MNSYSRFNDCVVLFFEDKIFMILEFCISKVVIYSVLIRGLLAAIREEKGLPWKEPAVANL